MAAAHRGRSRDHRQIIYPVACEHGARSATSCRSWRTSLGLFQPSTPTTAPWSAYAAMKRPWAGSPSRTAVRRPREDAIGLDLRVVLVGPEVRARVRTGRSGAEQVAGGGHGLLGGVHPVLQAAFGCRSSGLCQRRRPRRAYIPGAASHCWSHTTPSPRRRPRARQPARRGSGTDGDQRRGRPRSVVPSASSHPGHWSPAGQPVTRCRSAGPRRGRGAARRRSAPIRSPNGRRSGHRRGSDQRHLQAHGRGRPRRPRRRGIPRRPPPRRGPAQQCAPERERVVQGAQHMNPGRSAPGRRRGRHRWR